MSNRSGSPYSAPRDSNRVPFLLAASTADGVTPVVLEADPTTHALVTSGGSSGGGTQYANGTAVTTPTGSVALGYDGTNVRAMKTDNQGDGYTVITNGTNAADVVAGDTGFNGLVTNSGAKTIPFTISATGVPSGLPVSCEGYAWVEIQYTALGTGVAISGQFSSNGTNYLGVSSWQASSSTGNANGVLTATNNLFASPVWGTSFQLNVTAISTGPVSGIVTLTNAPRAFSTLQAAVSGTVALGAGAASIGTTQAGTSATSAITSVAGAATSTQLLASNTSRKAGYFFNDSTAILYLAYATSASSTAYTVQIAANGFFEMPVPVYTGAIFGIWASAAGSARITEGT